MKMLGSDPRPPVVAPLLEQAVDAPFYELTYPNATEWYDLIVGSVELWWNSNFYEKNNYFVILYQGRHLRGAGGPSPPPPPPPRKKKKEKKKEKKEKKKKEKKKKKKKERRELWITSNYYI